ncbi:MAG TPA: hypothetical protein PL085_11480 [Agriterribacter sp.]|uniref:hypothetical protein n=1 Tax=Agriterribacter sp. TaxID=2821509 RepID=UPI002CACCD5E|nr:hypothetical protein [Agriterribacter sp.]HRQ17690.1 hypothetical protein [Agriterribacter sp.]
MKYLIPILLLLASCTTLNKAILKVASETDFTPSQEALIATKCGQMFPPQEFISEGTKREDSASFKESYRALERALKDAGTDVENLVNLIEQKGQDNEVLRGMLFDSKKREDSLRITKHAYKSIPCPESHTRDTGYIVNTAKLAALQIKYDKLDRESAAKDLVIDKANASRQEAEEKLAQAKKDQWNLFWWGLAAGAGAVIGIGTFLKLKRII